MYLKELLELVAHSAKIPAPDGGAQVSDAVRFCRRHSQGALKAETIANRNHNVLANTCAF